MTTTLLITAISVLVERFVRQHGRIDCAALLVLLRALDIPAPRAHAGIARAIDRGAISLTDDDRQVLVVADPRSPSERAA